MIVNCYDGSSWVRLCEKDEVLPSDVREWMTQFREIQILSESSLAYLKTEISDLLCSSKNPQKMYVSNGDGLSPIRQIHYYGNRL